MPIRYGVIEVHTTEGSRSNNRPLWAEIVELARNTRAPARCVVCKGMAGCLENGESFTGNIEILSHDMPIKIEIMLPLAEMEDMLPRVVEMVEDGLVLTSERNAVVSRVTNRMVPRHILVMDAMTPSPVSVTPQTPLREIVAILMKSGFHALPVVDDSGRPVGMITQGDLVLKGGLPVRTGLLAEFDRGQVDSFIEAREKMTAIDLMTAPAVTVSDKAPLGEAIDLMLGSGLKRLPVVDEKARLAGMVARYDVFRVISTETPNSEILVSRGVDLVGARFVRDISTAENDRVLPGDTISRVMRVLASGSIQRVAVVDSEGRFLGIITDRDLLGRLVAHKAGIWDYLMAKMPFRELAARHRELIRLTTGSTAAEVMKTEVVTVLPDTPIDEAVRLMAKWGIKRLPVVGRDGRFNGMISRDAILRAGTAAAARFAN